MTNLIHAGMNIDGMAKHYGVSRRTISLWRIKRQVTERTGYGRPRRQNIDYELIDALLEEHRYTQGEIAMKAGCSVVPVGLRWCATHPGEKYGRSIENLAYRPYTHQNSRPHFNYAAAVERDLHRLHMRDFPLSEFDDFKNWLKTANGQNYFAKEQRSESLFPTRLDDQSLGANRQAAKNLGAM
jgi:hypothetical protein